MEAALSERRSQELGIARFTSKATGQAVELDIRAIPMIDEDNRAFGVSFMFTDVSSIEQVRANFNQMNQDLETAHEELQSANEELVTSNEELQSSYEELESSNEELQSANEELDTTNEELRSSNEQLETSNFELVSASRAIEELNATLVEANREFEIHSTLHRRTMDTLPFAVIAPNDRLLVEEWN